LRKYFTKNVIRTDEMSEIVNDSASDGGSFSELSDSDTCKVNSPFSSSSEEGKVIQPEPDMGMKRIHSALPKCTNTDFELGWKEQIQTVQKPAFSGVPGINKNFQITQKTAIPGIYLKYSSAQKCSNSYRRKHFLENRKKKKISSQWDHLLAIKWKNIRDVFILTTAHEDVLVEAPSSRGAHRKIKPAAVLDYNKYKTCVDRSDQMLSYYSFARKTIK